MGSKGIHISVALIVLASLMLIASLCLSWQHVSVFAGMAAMDEHIASVDMNKSFVARMVPGRTSGIKGTFTDVRNAVCELGTLHPFPAGLCTKFTMDFAIGIIVILFFVISIVLQTVAGCYLLYYITGRTKREYRKVAFRCLCAAPVLVFLAWFGYFISLLVTMATPLRVTILSLPVVVTPGSGFFVALMAFFVLCFVPCLARQWVLSVSEMVDSENRMYKQEARSQLLWDQNFRGMEAGHGAPHFDSNFCPEQPMHDPQGYPPPHPDMYPEPPCPPDVYPEHHYAPDMPPEHIMAHGYPGHDPYHAPYARRSDPDPYHTDAHLGYPVSSAPPIQPSSGYYPSYQPPY